MYKYQSGFGNSFETECLPGALPKNRNTPQKCAYGLVAEQLSGMPFTAPRFKQQRTWLYRIRPCAVHAAFAPVAGGRVTADFGGPAGVIPHQLRWSPHPYPPADKPTDFVAGLTTLMGAGSPALKTGMSVHMYAITASMRRKAFYSADGDMLFVPQEGELDIRTELGCLSVAPGEICVIQRGIRFAVGIGGPSRGYVCEVFNAHFVIPDLGPIGANGLANPRDFLTPVAAYEDVEEPHTVVCKYGGNLFELSQGHSPFDVVAWHGNYAPYKYDLAHFCVVNSVSYDHLDPSIFTVLTAQTAEPGTAACDFVIFPPRWCVQERTFRPPYYHRNVMSEVMGLIRGVYEAKKEGFLPGGLSLHSCMTGHGPDGETLRRAEEEDLQPARIPDGSTLAFMFETYYFLTLTEHGRALPKDEHYNDCWETVQKRFNPNQP